MKNINEVVALLILLLFSPLFARESEQSSSRATVWLENHYLRIGFRPDLAGRMSFLELKKCPGNLFAPVKDVRIPLLKELTIVRSNSNGSRAMCWERGAFRGDIAFACQEFPGKIF